MGGREAGGGWEGGRPGGGSKGETPVLHLFSLFFFFGLDWVVRLLSPSSDTAEVLSGRSSPGADPETTPPQAMLWFPRVTVRWKMSGSGSGPSGPRGWDGPIVEKMNSNEIKTHI